MWQNRQDGRQAWRNDEKCTEHALHGAPSLPCQQCAKPIHERRVYVKHLHQAVLEALAATFVYSLYRLLAGTGLWHPALPVQTSRSLLRVRGAPRFLALKRRRSLPSHFAWGSEHAGGQSTASGQSKHTTAVGGAKSRQHKELVPLDAALKASSKILSDAESCWDSRNASWGWGNARKQPTPSF